MSKTTPAEKEFLKLMKENPTQIIMWTLIQMGKMVVETNAATLDLKQESTFNGIRYEVKAKITAKKVKPIPPTTNQ
jgi:hypothetical protein